MMTAEQYAALDEPEGVRYELSKGELIVSPSAMMFHNVIANRINIAFVSAQRLVVIDPTRACNRPRSRDRSCFAFRAAGRSDA
jgi:hypothetical protein